MSRAIKASPMVGSTASGSMLPVNARETSVGMAMASAIDTHRNQLHFALTVNYLLARQLILVARLKLTFRAVGSPIGGVFGKEPLTRVEAGRINNSF